MVCVDTQGMKCHHHHQQQQHKNIARNIILSLVALSMYETVPKTLTVLATATMTDNFHATVDTAACTLSTHTC